MVFFAKRKPSWYYLTTGMQSYVGPPIVHLDTVSSNPVHQGGILGRNFRATSPHDTIFYTLRLLSDPADNFSPRHLASENPYPQRVEQTKFGRVDNFSGQIRVIQLGNELRKLSGLIHKTVSGSVTARRK